jgi:O-antigen ligase
VSLALAPSAARSANEPLATTLVLDLIALGAAAAGNALLAARANAAPIALVLIGAAIVLRIVQFRTALLKIPLHLPWLLFVATAIVGVSVSFDAARSLQKLDLILGGIALYYVLATTRTDAARRLVVWGLLAVCAGTAIYFLTQTDFSVEPSKITAITAIGMRLHNLSPQLGWSTPHSNLIAGILMLGLPFALAIGYDAWRHKQWLGLIGAAGFTLLLGFGLLMSTSRGAWLAMVLLGSVSVLAYGAGRLARQMGYSAATGAALVVNLLLIAFLILVAVLGSRLGDVATSLLGAANGVPRTELYQEVIQLTQGYSFTGAGLDTFSPNFSTYLLLINVPFLPHAHDMYLEIWFEQGILGILAFVWLLVAYYVWTVRRHARMNWLAIASAASFTLLLMHGLVDVLFYFSRVISLMFIPIGLTVAALEPFEPIAVLAPQTRRQVWIFSGAAILVVAVLLGAYALTHRSELTAQWNANKGAVEQAKIELPPIQNPPPTVSQVRREVNLDSAETLFNKALALDPRNVVAHTRLGLIALDQLDFAGAVGHLEAAYAAEPHNRAVVKALGYAYVWTGKFGQADPLLQQIPEAVTELGYSAGDWTKLGKPELSRNASIEVQRLKK